MTKETIAGAIDSLDALFRLEQKKVELYREMRRVLIRKEKQLHEQAGTVPPRRSDTGITKEFSK
jgi:hypothetical protein